VKRETIAYEKILYYTGNTSLMFFAFMIGVKGSVKKSDLKKAWLKVKQRYPLAGVRVEVTRDKKQFITDENVREIPIREFGKNETGWRTVVKKELCIPFDIYKGPMIRVILIQGENTSDVVFIFHHALCDGLSAVIFLHNLFLFLSDPDMPVNPSAEAPVFTRLIKKDILKIIKGKELPEWLKDKDKVELKPVKKEPSPRPDFVIHDWFFTEEQTKKIIRSAKKSGVSVHGILGAVLMKAFAQESGPKGSFKGVLQNPISFKPFLIDEARDYFGLFNGLIKVKIDCSPKRKIPKIAVDIYTKLRKQLDNYDTLISYYFFNEYFPKGIKDPDLFFANRPRFALDYDFSLSNLGVLQMNGQYGKYKVEEVYGPIFSAIKGEKVIGVATHQGKMFFNLIYDKKCFDPKIGTRIIKAALDSFDDIMG